MSDNGIDEDRLCIDEGSEHSMDVDEAPIAAPRSRAECENSDKPGPSTSTSEECPGPSTSEIVPKTCKSTTSSAPLVERLNLEKEANQLRTAFLAETIRRGRKRKLDLRKRYHEGLNRSVVCGICDDFLVDPVTVKNCGHSFCSSCMTEQLTSYKFYCYECGLKIDMDDKNSVIPDNTLRDLCFEVCPSVFYEYVTRRRKFIAADLKESVRFVQRARHLINDDDMICVLLSFVACPKLSHERKENENSMGETQGTRKDVTRMDTTVEESSEQDQKKVEDNQGSEGGMAAKELNTSEVEKEKRSEEKKTSSPMFYRYFRCRADTKVGTLRKLIEAKLFVAETTHIHFFLPKRLNTVLEEETTLQDMIVAHGWKPYAPYHLLFTLQKEQSPEPPQLEVEAMPELLPEAPSEMPPALESVSPEPLETPPPLMVTPIRENHQEVCLPFEPSASQHPNPIPLMRQNQNNSSGKKKKLSSSPTKKKSDCKIPTPEGGVPSNGPAPSSSSNSNSPPPVLAPSAPVSIADPYRSPSEASPASNSNQMPSIFPQTPTTTQLPVKQQQQQMPTKQQQQQMANALAGFQGLAGQPGPFSVAVMTPNGPMIQTMTAMGTPTGFPTNPFMPMMSQGCTSFLQSMQQRFQWPQQQMQQPHQPQQQQHSKPPKEKKPRSNASPRVSQQPQPQNFSPSAPPPVSGPPTKQKTPPNSTHSSNKKYEIVVTAIPEGTNALAHPQKPSGSAEQKPASIVSTKGDPTAMGKNSSPVSTQFPPLPHGLQFPGTIGAQSVNANGSVPTPFMISRPPMIPGQGGQNKQTLQVPAGQPTQSQHLPPTKPLRSVDHPGPKPSSVDKAILESLKAMKKREQSSKTSPPTGFNIANQAFFRQSAVPVTANAPMKFPQKSQQSKATNSVGKNGVATMPKITEVMRVQTPPTSQKKSSQTPDLSTADVPLNMSISKMVPPTLKVEGSVPTAPRPIVSPVGNSQSGRDAPLPVLVKELPSARASPSSPNLVKMESGNGAGVKKEEVRKEERPPQILIGKQQVDLSYLQRNCSADVLARLTGQTLGKALMQSLKKSPAEETAPHLRRMSSSSGGSDTTTLGVTQTMRPPLVVPASGQHT